MKNYQHIYAFIEVFLFVSGLIASVYLLSGILVSASAQESSSEDDFLTSQGYSTEFTNPDDATSAAGEFGNSYAQSFFDDSSFASGFISFLTGKSFPAVQQVAGHAVQQHLADVTGGSHVCPLTVDEEICQPMQGNECDANCDVDCIPGTLEDLPSDSPCSLVTCYDGEEGFCQPRTPRQLCEEFAGEVFDDPSGNLAVCQRGCCIAGNEASFVTERACERRAEINGLSFGDEIRFESSESEFACLGSVYSQNEGACVFSGETELNDCDFVHEQECTSLGGEFFSETLCSHPDLNTHCSSQATTSCIDGLDGVYWLDSCGNRENVYEGDSSIKRAESWNEGFIKDITESCVLGSGGDPVRNQASCGNCNRLSGSICGDERLGEELGDDPDGGVVCLDQGCVDGSGVRRENGESWCGYQGQIGLVGADSGALDLLRGFVPSNPLLDLVAGDRSVDTPGSSHYRLSCLNGEVSVNSCDSHRNYVCVESRSSITASEREFSEAACRPNRWQECLAYNPNQVEGRILGMAGKASGKILKAKLEATCGLDPDCFVKDVHVADAFQFSYCAPRYPPGFDIVHNPEVADQICSQASQTCTVIYVKKVSGWECEENCECEEAAFAQQMNEFCTSLGDCGASANYVGALGSGGYSVSEGEQQGLEGIVSSFLGRAIPQVDASSLTSLTYAEPIPGEYIPANASVIEGVAGNWIENIFADLGVDTLFDQITSGSGSGGTRVPRPSGDATSAGIDVALIPGGAGAATLGTQVASTGVAWASGGTIPNLANTFPGYLGFTSFTVGASLGSALIGFLIDALGIGPGLGSGLTYGLIGTGGAGAGIVGYQFFKGGLAATTANPVGWVLFGAVIVTIIILKLFGVGDIEEREVRFECQPWAPPIVGDCESCGEDVLSDGTPNFPCNRYACEALGQNCVFDSRSEGPEGGVCVSADSKDTSSPRIIHLDEEILTEGFGYRDFSEAGFKIRRKAGNECLSQFESMSYGFTLDEYGRCAFSAEKKQAFEDMIPLPGGISKDHVQRFSSLDLDSISVTISEEQEEVRFFLACEDIRGNSNVLNPYIVNVCIDPEDFTPPELTYVDTGALPFGVDEHELVIYVNEPSEVRWSYFDVSFSEMDGEFLCDFENRVARGFSCIARVPIDSDLTTIYVRARDQPTLEEVNQRNINQESLMIEIIRSEQDLKIDSIGPDNEIIVGGFSMGSVDVIATTSGGLDGSARCFLSVDDGIRALFEQTGGSTHRQQLTTITNGVHDVRVWCEDAAGNRASGSASFEYRVESSIPQVARVYANNGNLFVVTNEKATCAYSETLCGFRVDEGVAMSSSNDGLVHFSEFVQGENYFVKCADEFGNEGNECDIDVSGSVF